jgi:uncharacterized protein (DUF952 family)
MTTTRQFVFKVASRAHWLAACHKGAFLGSADDLKDGFIHLSLREQLPATLAKHFRDQHDLVLVQFAARTLGDGCGV